MTTNRVVECQHRCSRDADHNALGHKCRCVLCGTFFSGHQLLAQFEALVQAHDLTFEYSDDFRTWHRGKKELDEIRRLAKNLAIEDVRRIWNANADLKIGSAESKRWHWPL